MKTISEKVYTLLFVYWDRRINVFFFSPASEEGEVVCLVRATDGKKKISSHVRGKDVVRFQMSLNTIQRANMDALKRKEKNKSKGKRRPRAAVA